MKYERFMLAMRYVLDCVAPGIYTLEYISNMKKCVEYDVRGVTSVRYEIK